MDYPSIMTPRSVRVARVSILSALSVIGSFIHPPSPIQTVAFDSFPGFFAALYFGAYDGALVCGIGHIITSVVNGFPLGPLHLVIALGMAAAGCLMGLANRIDRRWGFTVAAPVGVAVNTSLVVVLVPVAGWYAAAVFTPFLLLAASLNVVAAVLVYLPLRCRRVGV